MNSRSSFYMVLAASLMLSAGACSKEQDKAPVAAQVTAPAPTQQALRGPVRPALLLTHAWFWKDENGSPKPGPARLDIWRQGPKGWDYTRLEDDDSNVFHKALPYQDGILTIGAERAMLKKWTFSDGAWHFDTLWERDWGGQFDRLRDVEIGDVNGDGRDDIVIATHDAGVVAVVEPSADGSPPKVTEMDRKPDTFVHEIEIADIDGDGKLEFFATPSDRNKVGHSQAGGVVMYRWDGNAFRRSWVEHQEGTHAKEILAYDMDGDGRAELFSVLEAEVDPDDRRKIIKPVEIRQYDPQPDGSFKYHVVATINDRQTRFLVPGDFDGDGRMELIAAAFKTGLYHLTPPSDPASKEQWKIEVIDSNSSGFEHAAYATDLDGDGKIELYVAADDQRQLKRYDRLSDGRFKKTLLGRLEEGVLTWNITAGKF